VSGYDIRMKQFHRKVCDQYGRYLAGVGFKDRVIESYQEYLKTGDMMEFEKKTLVCTFFLSLSQYQQLLDSDCPSARFLYSDLEYKVLGTSLEYEVFGEKYLVSPKGSAIFQCMIPVEKQVQLNILGLVQHSVPYPMREVVSDGQMKIFTDLFKLVQGGEDRNQRVLIVGSASQSTGGSKSYDLLQYMFQDSVFELYDPHDSNDCYESARGNRYMRYASVFKYTADIVKYDYVQDDAFIRFDGNRDKIDPEKHLFRARRFSCKRLDGDADYFKTMKCEVSGPTHCCYGCKEGVGCVKSKFDSKACYGYRQVGRVATSEVRVMSHVPVLGLYQDKRFGTCAFCREMFFYCNKKYPDEFFSALASIHSIGSRCSIKRLYQVPRCDGNVDYKGRKFHVLQEVDNPVCMAYDPVLDFPLVTNFVAFSKRTYVFSSVENVLFSMFAGRIAIYDSLQNRYYVNYQEEFFSQSDDYDEIINGVRFRYVGDFRNGIRLDKEFSLKECSVEKLFFDIGEGYPILNMNVLKNRSYSVMLDLARFYGSFYLEYGDKKMILV